MSNSESGNDHMDVINQNPIVDSSVPVANLNTVPNPNTAPNPNPSSTFVDTYATFTTRENLFVNPNPSTKANTFVFTASDPNKHPGYPGITSANPFASASSGMPYVAQTAPMRPMTVHSEKPDKFTGTNFKRWQQKMMFYLTTLQLTSFLKEDPYCGL
ncbi:hypothetical protein ACS0TY_034952 [Phlomoides rotata]